MGINTVDYWNILYDQLAIDYCCSPDAVRAGENHFAEFQFLACRRTFLEQKECYLKITVINGKLLFTGRSDILNWCKKQYCKNNGEWFFEAKNMHRLNERIYLDGYQISSAHPFFIPENEIALSSDDYDFRWYEADDIEQFRGNSRYQNAFGFCKKAPDVIGVAAIQNGDTLGMAGASCDSPTMWQIGIDTDKSVRQRGIGKLLVSMLKKEILERGILPFYGTGMSHIGSQNVALGAGFKPAWAELVTEKVKERGI